MSLPINEVLRHLGRISRGVDDGIDLSRKTVSLLEEVRTGLSNVEGSIYITNLPSEFPDSVAHELLGSIHSKLRDLGGALASVGTDRLLADVFNTITARFADFVGRTVNPGEWFTVISETGRGLIREFHVRSPNTSFKVSITVDGVATLEKTYDELRQIEQNSLDISAFAELDENGDPTGYYVASIRNIPYYSSALLRVQNMGTSPITFSQLFAKYHILSGG